MVLAGLAGVGAASLVAAVASAAVLELWYQRIIAAPGPPPYVPEPLALAFFVGAFVAVRRGGLRAASIVVAYAVVLLSPLVGRGIIEPLVQCAIRGCTAPTYVERPLGMAWAVLGIVLGVLAAAGARVRVPLAPGLAAAGVLAFVPPLENDLELFLRYTACFSPQFIERCLQPYAALSAASWIASGLTAAVLLVRWGEGPWDVILPGVVLALTHTSVPIHDFGSSMREFGLLFALGQAAPLLGILVFIVVALAFTVGAIPRARLLAFVRVSRREV